MSQERGVTITEPAAVAALTRLYRDNGPGNLRWNFSAPGRITAYDQTLKAGESGGLTGLELIFADRDNNATLKGALELADLADLESISLNGTNFSELVLINLPSLKTVKFENNKLRKLKDLSGLPKLAELNLRGNQLTDISPLAGLAGLTSLDFRENGINDLTPLAGLRSLVVLGLDLEKPADLGPLLADLPDLTTLRLRSKTIKDCSFLSELPFLMELEIYFDEIITDLTPFSGLTALARLDLSIHWRFYLRSYGHEYDVLSDDEEVVYLSDEEIVEPSAEEMVDLSPLASLTDLTELKLCLRYITNLRPLASLKNLAKLDLSVHEIDDLGCTEHGGSPGMCFSAEENVDLSPLARLTALMELKLHLRFIATLSPLADLKTLTKLDLESYDSISDLWPLAALTSLTELKLRFNIIEDLSPLAGLTALTVLTLRSNKIKDLSPLADLTSLVELDLYENPISDVSPLAGLTAMKKLYLCQTWIEDISPLVGLTSLEELDLYRYMNPLNIEDHSPLAGLTALQKLSLHRIRDLSPLAGLVNLVELNLRYYPIRGQHSCDLSPLAGLAALEKLNLVSNQKLDLEPLSGLPALTELKLGINDGFGDKTMMDLSGLSGSASLTTLILEPNHIQEKSLAALTGLPGLTGLYTTQDNDRRNNLINLVDGYR